MPVTETTWRIMQNMDMRFRDETGRVMASVRVAQRPGPDSVYHVLNGAGEPLLDIDDVAVEGITGMAQDLVISDTITLHMDETTFLGSGLTAIMSPTITFGPNAVGRWRVEFRVDKTIDELGSFVQDEDILGTITIADPSCALPVDSLEIVGQDQVQTGVDAHYSLDLLPLGASQPVTITWSPMPLSGQGTTTATYRWAEAGKPVIFVSAQNCDRFAANLKEVSVYTTPSADLAVRADAPAVVAKESPVTFSLVLSNSGQITATNLVVVAQLPVGGTHVAGGTLNGNEVMWMLPSLDGYGVAQTLTMTVLPSAALTQVILSTYRVQADGGINVQGAPSATTALADAVAVMDPMQFTQLAYPAGAAYSMTVDLPVGAVADPTLLAATEAADLPGAPPSELQASGRVFRLEMLQFNLPQNPFTLTEAITVALNYPSTPPLVEASDRAGAATAPTLYHWSGSAWSDTGIVCQPGVGANTLTCILERPVSGTYALLQTVGGDDGHKVLLPLIQAQPGP